MNDLLNTIASAGPLQLILAMAMLLAGPAMIAAAFIMKPKPAAPVRPQQTGTAAPVLSQVGFVEIEGRVLPFRALVRQSETLDDQQLAAFQRHLTAPLPSRYAA